jgi:phage terminase small subunit
MAKPTTVNQSALSSSASQLNANPRIIEYRQAVQAEIAERFMVTAESLIAELEEARQIGIQIKAPGPMVAATMGKAKLVGLDKQIIEHKGPDMATILQGLIEKLPG